MAQAYDIIGLGCDSNMGQGHDYDAAIDLTTAAVQQYKQDKTVAIAAETLDNLGMPAGCIGPALAFARDYYVPRHLIGSRKVLLVPRAHAGTGLSVNSLSRWATKQTLTIPTTGFSVGQVINGATSGAQAEVGTVTDSGHMDVFLMGTVLAFVTESITGPGATATATAVAAPVGGDKIQALIDSTNEAVALNPGGNKVKCFLMSNGANDVSGESHFTGKFKYMATKLRNDTNSTGAPIIITDMVPAWVTASIAAGSNAGFIQAELAALPASLSLCGQANASSGGDGTVLTASPLNGGIHFDAPSMRELGRRAAEKFAQLYTPTRDAVWRC